MPKIVINGKEIEFENGMTVLQACELANGEIQDFVTMKLSIVEIAERLVEMEKPETIASCNACC